MESGERVGLSKTFVTYCNPYQTLHTWIISPSTFCDQVSRKTNRDDMRYRRIRLGWKVEKLRMNGCKRVLVYAPDQCRISCEREGIMLEYIPWQRIIHDGQRQEEISAVIRVIKFDSQCRTTVSRASTLCTFPTNARHCKKSNTIVRQVICTTNWTQKRAHYDHVRICSDFLLLSDPLGQDNRALTASDSCRKTCLLSACITIVPR